MRGGRTFASQLMVLGSNTNWGDRSARRPNISRDPISAKVCDPGVLTDKPILFSLMRMFI